MVNDGIAGRDGTDHLTHIEFLQFADGVIDASGLVASPANNSGSTLQGLATDGSCASPPQVDGDDGIESVRADAEGRPLGLRPFFGGGYDRLTFDHHESSPSGSSYEAGGTSISRAVSYIPNSAGRDIFIFSETVRHDAAGLKAEGSIGHGVSQTESPIVADVAHLSAQVVTVPDHGHDAPVTSLISDHLLFT